MPKTIHADSEVRASALEAVTEAVGIYDAADRLVDFNSRYAELRSAIAGDVVLGVPWSDLVTASVRAGTIPEAVGREEAWLERRRRVRGAYSIVRELPDGRAYQVSERRMSNGDGIVVVWSAISRIIKPKRRLRVGRQVLFRMWASKGLSVRACTALTLAGCRSPADVHELGYTYFMNVENCGRSTLQEIEKLIGGWADPARGSEQHDPKYSRSRPRGRNRKSSKTPTKKCQPEDPLFAAVAESSNEAIIIKDLNGVILSWNKAAERLFGYTAAEVIGQSITIIFPPDRVEEEVVFLDRIRSGETVEHHETARRRKDGQIINVSATISPIRDADGTVVGASKIMSDLTDRDVWESRIRELQVELAHVQRLTELGRGVSTLVHEVNQPLTAINNYVNACVRLVSTGDGERIQATLERIANQTNRTREVVRRIRDFVKKQDVEMRTENLRHVIEEAIELARTNVRDAEVALSTRIEPTGLQVEIDKVQVQQVIFNLLRNGIEAMLDQSRRELVVATTLVQGGMVEISVADTGSGLSDEVRKKLFQPFVTTKANGMGVGLSVCRAIVESHGGQLWADDNPGGGTIFRFTVRHAGG